MTPCLFVSDLHGALERYRKLWEVCASERPAAIFLGGDLTPRFGRPAPSRPGAGNGFLGEVVAPGFERLRDRLGEAYPRVFLILGNDDPRVHEADLRDGEARGLWRYLHGRRDQLGGRPIYGYACVPPTPFLLKDWERYDVSRHVDPGCVSPEEGRRSVAAEAREARFATIAKDLESLVGDEDVTEAIFLFHTPPYRTSLDRAALDGRKVDHVPLDVHVGSIAVRRFLEARGPKVSLHGHIHESARLTGRWMERVGRTVALQAAHDGPELSLVRFDPEQPEAATRELL